MRHSISALTRILEWDKTPPIIYLVGSFVRGVLGRLWSFWPPTPANMVTGAEYEVTGGDSAKDI
jgi:hypothetical protein